MISLAGSEGELGLDRVIGMSVQSLWHCTEARLVEVAQNRAEPEVFGSDASCPPDVVHGRLAQRCHG